MWVMLMLTLTFIFYTAYQFLPTNLKVDVKKIDRSLIVGQIILLVYLLKLTTIALSNFKIGFATNEHIHLLVMILSIGAMTQLAKWARGKYLSLFCGNFLSVFRFNHNGLKAGYLILHLKITY